MKSNKLEDRPDIKFDKESYDDRISDALGVLFEEEAEDYGVFVGLVKDGSNPVAPQFLVVYPTRIEDSAQWKTAIQGFVDRFVEQHL